MLAQVEQNGVLPAVKSVAWFSTIRRQLGRGDVQNDCAHAVCTSGHSALR